MLAMNQGGIDYTVNDRPVLYRADNIIGWSVVSEVVLVISEVCVP